MLYPNLAMRNQSLFKVGQLHQKIRCNGVVVHSSVIRVFSSSSLLSNPPSSSSSSLPSSSSNATIPMKQQQQPQTFHLHTTRTTSTTATANKITKRPFQILGIQQVAVGSTDLQSLRTFWMDILGLPKINTHTSEKENVMEDILIIGPSLSSSSSSSSSKKKTTEKQGLGNHSISSSSPPPVELDLMCPIDEHKSPKVHQPPLNHIGLWIDDLPTAVEWMKSKGVRFTPGGIRKGAAGYDVTFIHPKGNDESPIGGCGVLVELVQAPTSVIKALKK